MRSFFVLLMAALAYADLYMHNPRGSNNRLNEDNANRDNGNRLFDSQNNNKGGYCAGPMMSYYASSQLTIEWTNQHSCGKEGKTHCELVLQYMCQGRNNNPKTQIRDGATTDTITTDNYMVTTEDGETYMYGMHESYDYYMSCQTRMRNMGLFIADRNLNGQTARFTRQNPNGNRRGFECPEERDYYPYWHPTPWKDIAILTSNTDNCDIYQDHSFNNKDVKLGWCWDGKQPAAPNNKKDCEGDGFTWKTENGWDIDDPECLEAPWTRDNHLGNAFDSRFDPAVHAAHYNWTIPEDEPCIEKEDCTCVLRLRYNISTEDTDNWPSTGENGDKFIDAKSNGNKSPIKNDPWVEVAGAKLALELNTDQYGRVFQDRSYTFSIMKRPSISSFAEIFNLNVRGKRGNIVQAYPSVEYDFVPTVLFVRQWDYIHFQWTGCDTNPAGNAGQGLDQTDRSNIVQIAGLNDNMPISAKDMKSMSDSDKLFPDEDMANNFAFLGQTNCAPDSDDQQDPGNCLYLNRADPYFDGGLIKMNSTGTYYFMSTRNNNFSNRSHKGTIQVGLPLTFWEIFAIVVAGLVIIGAATFGGVLFHGKSHPHAWTGSVYEKMANLGHKIKG